MNDKTSPDASIDAELIKTWKRKYPQGIYQLSVAGLDGFIRMPTDNEMIAFCTKNRKADGRELGRKFIKMLWLGGERAIIDSNDLFDQTESQLLIIVKKKEAQMNRRNGIIYT